MSQITVDKMHSLMSMLTEITQCVCDQRTMKEFLKYIIEKYTPLTYMNVNTYYIYTAKNVEADSITKK